MNQNNSKVWLLRLFLFSLLSLNIYFLIENSVKYQIYSISDFENNAEFDGRIINPYLILILVISAISLIGVMSVNEYRIYISKHKILDSNRHRLKIEDIFDNENRKLMLNYILSQPGIHQNELLRKCNLKAGQLKWHLGILIEYGIIRKSKIGQYVTYYPTLLDIDIDEYNEAVFKSNTTKQVLEIIKDNPPITASTISNKLNLHRSSVKYHIDKLYRNKLIILNRVGREIEIIPK